MMLSRISWLLAIIGTIIVSITSISNDSLGILFYSGLATMIIGILGVLCFSKDTKSLLADLLDFF